MLPPSFARRRPPQGPLASAALLIAVSLALATALASGCGAHKGTQGAPEGVQTSATSGAGGTQPGTTTSGAGGATFAGNGNAETGKACSPDGKTQACGHVTHRQGNIVECSVGSQKCVDLKWAPCVIESFKTITVPEAPSGATPDGLGSNVACTNDPCDPNCETFTDTATGLDAGADSGVQIDGGILIKGVVGSGNSTCTGLTAAPTPVSAVVTNIPESVLNPISYTFPTPASFNGQFAASFTPAGCYMGNAPAIWTVDQTTLATISNTGLFNLVVPLPGVINVKATSGSWSAPLIPVTVTVNAVDVANGPSPYNVLANYPSQWASGAADSITVLYPYNATVMPLGQLAPTIQWDNLGTAATAVRIQLRYPAGTGAQFTWSGVFSESSPYFSCPPYQGCAPTISDPSGGQPRVFIPQPAWKAFEQASQGGTADFVIQRVVGGVARAPNPPVNLTFAGANVAGDNAHGVLKGTVYYQSYGTRLALNYCCAQQNSVMFGAATLGIQPGATAPVLVAGSNGNNNQCLVCHSVAAGGSMLVTQWGANYGDSIAVNTSTLGQTNTGLNFAWPAVSPDGTYMFANSTQPGYPGLTAGSNTPSQLYSLPSGTPIAGLFNGASSWAIGPSFSPDSSHIAFTWPAASNMGILSLDHNPANHALSNWRWLNYTGSAYPGTLYYPSYLPSSAAVVYELETVFNGRDYGGTRSQCDAGGVPTTCQNDGTHAELWWTVASGTGAGSTARLDKANGLGYLPTHPSAAYSTGNSYSVPVYGNIPQYTWQWVYQGPQTIFNASPGTYFSGNYEYVFTGYNCNVGPGCLYTVYNWNWWWGGYWDTEWDTGTPPYTWWSGNYEYVLDDSWDYNYNVYLYEQVLTGYVWGIVGYNYYSNAAGCVGGTAPAGVAGGTYCICDATCAANGGLNAGNAGEDSALNYEPTVMPQSIGGYSWMVFTSRRRYGNIATINPFWSDPRFQDISQQPTTKKLWVAAIDGNPTPGADPSHPAFYLQGQELPAGNSRAYWVQSPCKVAGPPLTGANLCTSNLDCCTGAGVSCQLDAAPATTSHCSNAAAPACTPLGGACVNGSTCCGFPSNVCAQGACTLPSPPLTYSTTTWTRDYDATNSCPAGTHVVWVDAGLEAIYTVSNGTYSSIQIEAQAGTNVGSLGPATPINIGTEVGSAGNLDQSMAWANYDLNTPLTANGSLEGLPYLRLTFVLNPTADHQTTPDLVDWRARFDCAPSE